jgi:hypothetical protein
VHDDPPPILGKWSRLYAGVLGWLAVLIFLFWLFAKIWSGGAA